VTGRGAGGIIGGVESAFMPGLRLAGRTAWIRPAACRWLGTAFGRVPGTEFLAASLTGALAATGGRGREEHLGQAYVTVAQAHNRLGLTEPLDVRTRRFYDRPYEVLDAGRFAAALTAAIADPRLTGRAPIGAADQFMDSTDALGDARYPRAVIDAAIIDAG